MWEELYEAHYRELTAYLIHMSVTRELAEDLVQEAFAVPLVRNCTRRPAIFIWWPMCSVIRMSM